jgi:hypothetical protein
LSKVLVVPALSRKKIEDRAVSILREEQPEAFAGKCPVDIEMIYEIYVPERCRVKTMYTDLKPLGSGVLGYTDASKKISCVDKHLIDAIDIATERRCRATVGHEIGHCIYHVPILSFFKSSSLLHENEGLYRRERTEIKPYLDPEWQAWEFARACLMPRHLIVKYCEKGYSIREMAKCFHVNPVFVEVRLNKLNIKPL